MYKNEYCAKATSLCLLGLTNEQLAEHFGVTPPTIYNWINRHPAFREALINGREIADCEVSNALYQRATGFISEDGQYFPPDTTACIFWLKNRQPHKWRDKVTIEQRYSFDKGELEIRKREFDEQMKLSAAKTAEIMAERMRLLNIDDDTQKHPNETTTTAFVPPKKTFDDQSHYFLDE